MEKPLKQLAIRNTALCLLVGAAMSLSACAEYTGFKVATAGLFATSHGFFSRPDVNLKEKNYAAADYLISQMRDDLSLSDSIALMPLEELDHSGITSPLGMKISEGIGRRFEELGYDVLFSKVLEGGQKELYEGLEEGRLAKIWLKGNYIIKGEDVHVSLRVVSRVSQKVIASFDYAMPLSSEIYQLSKTEAQIIKLD